jgi:hypothetical protein
MCKSCGMYYSFFFKTQFHRNDCAVLAAAIDKTQGIEVGAGVYGSETVCLHGYQSDKDREQQEIVENGGVDEAPGGYY